MSTCGRGAPWRLLRCACGAVALASVTPILAAEPEPTEQPVAPVGTPAGAEPERDEAEPQPTLTPEEQEALERSLGADQAAKPSALDALGPVGGAIQSMNPDIAVVLDFAAAWFSGDGARGTGGHDPQRTGFNLRQLEMSIGASVDPVFRFDANLVFAQYGVELEEAYGTTLGIPGGLQVRFGQMLTRFGRINSTHPHAWSFVDQPLVNGKMFGSEGSRGLGGELSWLTPLPWYVELVASASEAGGEATARSFFGGDDLGVSGPEDLLYTLALKQFSPFDDDWSLAWGLSAQLGPNSTGNGNRTEIYGSDLYLRYYPVATQTRMSLSLTVEGMFRTRQVPDDVLQDWGGYAQLVWGIDREWEVGARAEVVSGREGDPLDPQWDGDRARYALEGTYYPSHFSRIRLQAAADVPAWLDEPVWSVALAVELVVGAHGSHAF